MATGGAGTDARAAGTDARAAGTDERAAGTDARAAGTDERAARFVPLYEAHFSRVVAYARRRTSAQQADDVAAETFSIAWRRLDAIPGDRELPWLYGVARRVLAGHRRADLRRQRLVARLQGLAAPGGPPGDGPADPCESLRLRDALDRLGDGDREILWLATWQDLPVREIAATMGCSANAAAVRLHRARRRLAGVLWAGDAPGAPGRDG